MELILLLMFCLRIAGLFAPKTLYFRQTLIVLHHYKRIATMAEVKQDLLQFMTAVSKLKVSK